MLKAATFRRRFWLSLAILLLGSSSTWAQSIPEPVISSLGVDSYVVSYEPCTLCLGHALEESVGNTGVWTQVGTGSQTFTQRTPGIYRYRAVYIDTYDYGIFLTLYSAAVAIVIDSTPATADDPPPSMALQLATNYDVRAGDADFDGRADLLIMAGAAELENSIPDVLLRQTASGAFETRVPSEYLLANATNWSPADVEMTVRDVNIDGYADLVLRDLSALTGFQNSRNQIVFAPGSGQTQQLPKIRSIDPTLAKFSVDINRHLIDPDYYWNNAPIVYEVYVYYMFSCGWDSYLYSPDYYNPWVCYFEPSYYLLAYTDYSMFDDDAISIATTDHEMIHGAQDIASGMNEIEATLERVLEVEVGGWDVVQIIGESAAQTDAQRRGIELFSVLAGISEAAAQESDDAVAVADSDRVLLKGRRVLGEGPFHTALEYHGETVSAFDSDPRALFDGLLVSVVNWGPDHPSLTMQLGFVDGPVVPSLYWGSIRAADGRYDDRLRYDLFPSVGDGGYNSNSFVAGLIQATAGRSTVAMSTFVGGEKPVPASEFN